MFGIWHLVLAKLVYTKVIGKTSTRSRLLYFEKLAFQLTAEKRKSNMNDQKIILSTCKQIKGGSLGVTLSAMKVLTQLL